MSRRKELSEDSILRINGTIARDTSEGLVKTKSTGGIYPLASMKKGCA